MKRYKQDLILPAAGNCFPLDSLVEKITGALEKDVKTYYADALAVCGPEQKKWPNILQAPFVFSKHKIGQEGVQRRQAIVSLLAQAQDDEDQTKKILIATYCYLGEDSNKTAREIATQLEAAIPIDNFSTHKKNIINILRAMASAIMMERKINTGPIDKMFENIFTADERQLLIERIEQRLFGGCAMTSIRKPGELHGSAQLAASSGSLYAVFDIWQKDIMTMLLLKFTGSEQTALTAEKMAEIDGFRRNGFPALFEQEQKTQVFDVTRQLPAKRGGAKLTMAPGAAAKASGAAAAKQL